jgi:hypothetical protein
MMVLLGKEGKEMKEKTKTKLVLEVFKVFIVMVIFLPVLASAGRSLDERIPPTWSQKMLASERFELVFDGLGFLDKETGLVWEQSPTRNTFTWASAISHCITLEVVGRKGWHFPTIEQLVSIVDTWAGGYPKLTRGHPFDTDCTTTGCVLGEYWSATSDAISPDTNAWQVDITIGEVLENESKLDNAHSWCVRGGQSYDAY